MMHHVPYTTLSKSGYGSRATAVKFATAEVKRLFGEDFAPQEGRDYQIEFRTARDDLPERYFVNLVNDAYMAYADQPVTFVLQAREAPGVWGYPVEKDRMVSANLLDPLRTKGIERLVTIEARPSMQGILNRSCANGYAWVRIEEHIFPEEYGGLDDEE